MSEDAWKLFAAAFGDEEFDDMELLAAVTDKDYTEALAQSKLGIIKRASLNVMFAKVKAKFDSFSNPSRRMTLSTGSSITDCMVLYLARIEIREIVWLVKIENLQARR